MCRAKTEKTRLLALTAALAVFLVCPTPMSFGATPLAQAKQPRKAMLLLVDGLSLKDLEVAKTPHLDQLLKRGALGLMNVRTARGIDRGSSYLTIGSGAKAKAGGSTKIEVAGLAFNAQETYGETDASQAFFRQTGRKASSANVVHLGMADILRVNAELPYNSRPGALGEALKKAGFKVAVLGNADIPQEIHREVVLVGMDGLGRVDQGDVGENLLKRDPESPFGLRTDYGRLLSRARRFLSKNDLLIIELGDTARVNFYTIYSMDRALERQRRLALERADSFLGKLLAGLDLRRTLVIVATPSPSQVAYRKRIELVPIIAAGAGFRQGVLSSATTRRHGIVASIDIAPTILKFFGIETPDTMAGRPLLSQPEKDPFGWLNSVQNRLVAFSLARQPTLTSYVVFTIAFVALSVIALASPSLAQKRLFFNTLKASLLWTLGVPATLLIIALFPPANPTITLLISLLVSLLIAWLFFKAGRHSFKSVAYLCLATSGLILIDLLAGSSLMGASLLGHSAQTGARFYGIGNEYMGVLVGASIIGLTLLKDARLSESKPYRRLSGLVFFVSALAIGLPSLGANFGGAISATIAYGTTWFKFSGRRFSLKEIIIASLSVFLILAGLVSYDLLRGPASSHLGKAFLAAKSAGLEFGLNIIKRKLSMNIRLIQYTIWSKVLIAALAVFAFFSARPAGAWKKVSQRHPGLSAGLLGVAAGSIAALLFNDSGVVAAATAIIFAISTLLYVIIEDTVADQSKVI